MSLIVQWISVRLPLPEPSFAKLEVTLLIVAAVLAGLVALAARTGPVWSGWKSVAVWSGLATVSTSVLSIPLHGTRWYLGGLFGDNMFRIPYFTHMTASATPVDMTYRGLPSFYSVGWFWTGGRFASFSGLPGWTAYKDFAILTMAVVPALAFSLWSMLLTRKTALALATVTAVAGAASVTPMWEPYAWAVYALAPPIVVLMGRVLRSPRNADAARRRWALAGVGAFIGVAGDVYALIGGVLVLVAVGYGVVALLPRRSGLPDTGVRALPRGTVIARLAAIGAVAAAFMIPVWAAYLGKALAAGMPPNPAQDFLPETSAQFSLPMFAPTFEGAFFLGGVVWLVVAARRDQVAAGLAALAAGAVAWHVLSVLAVFKNTTLLSVSANVVLYPTLYCAGVLGVIDTAGWVRRHHAELVERAHPVLAAGVVVVAGVSVVQTGQSDVSSLVGKAYSQPVPSGTAADGTTRDPHTAEDYDREIRNATGRAPRDTVILNPPLNLIAAYPYWNFQAPIPQYSNPLADYDGRNAEITRWSAAKTPEELLKELDTSRFTPPTVFVFESKPDGWHSWIEEDHHLNSPEHSGHDVVFSPKAFESPAFVRWTTGSTVIVARR
ncbi:galactan 5-O-arabinofuranosyltransferase [Catenulispora subtropica]|uniref:Galactan 5-O-arabinofuranosyltransferase n=1 Tax=Catenulispora subtropica TaxID=450798 RepID=A0ABN2QMR9_9ACTN